MTPMPDVQLPDGSIASFPDSMSDAEIEVILQARFPAPKPSGRQVARRPDTLINIIPPEAKVDFFDSRKVPRVLRRAPR